MDDKIPSSTEDLVREMLERFKVEGGQPGAAGAAPGPLSDNPPGFLNAIEEWAAEHPEAAAGLAHAVVSAAPDALEAMPLAPLLMDLTEAEQAFLSAGENIDELLRLRAPRIVSAPNGTTKMALLTLVTDHAALFSEIIRRSAARPHRRAEGPSFDMHLAEAHHADELRRSYGLSLRQVLDIEDLPASSRAEVLFRPLISSVNTSSPQLGEGIEWLLRNQPEALLAMPTTLAVTDALQGNLVPREQMRLRFAHLVEREGIGYCAFLMWDSEEHLTARQRTALAGHIRDLSDTAVAPWNRFPDLRRRRETFAIWLRHLCDQPLDAPELADVLRARHAAEYRTEPRDKTVRRIYRISTQLSGVRLPPVLMKLMRAEGDE